MKFLDAVRGKSGRTQAECETVKNNQAREGLLVQLRAVLEFLRAQRFEVVREF